MANLILETRLLKKVLAHHVAQENGAEGLCLGRADGQAWRLASATRVDADDQRDGDVDDPPALADPQGGDVDPEAQPLALDWPDQGGSIR